MSRSNPEGISLPNPCTRWMEWHGTTGKVKHYDKAKEAEVQVAPPLTFILLDILAWVGGYDADEKCDIYSNEIKDQRSEIVTVTSRTGGIVASGLYGKIKEAANEAGADYHASLYVAYKDGKELKIGNLRLKGTALSSWLKFKNKHRAQVYEQALVISGATSETNGGIEYKTPVFGLKPVSIESQAAATALDVELQAYLNSRPATVKVEPIEPVAAAPVPPKPDLDLRDVEDIDALPVQDTDIYADDIPF